jgi:transcriptional regulator with PAS, ATPase and Fis domain
MKQVMSRLREMAKSDATVLIYGKTGTGKELTAEGLHEHSARNDGPYIVVDCAAIPEELIESELFGHVKGAFTGAQADRAGAFEAAHKGTIFIDEIGELPLELQARILRVLEKQQLKRVGSNKQRQVDVRIIAATNRTLEKEVERGRFRQDLFYRLNVLKVEIPSLKDRPSDLEPLIKMFLANTPTISGEALEIRQADLQRLLDYHWPGNVRELRNIIERGASLSDKFFRVPEDLELSAELYAIDEPYGDEADTKQDESENRLRVPADGESVTEILWRGRPYKEARELVMADFEKGYITALLREHDGNVSGAARAAGIHRNILHRMMVRYDISR